MSGDWKRGMRMLARGLYIDEKDGSVHIDAKEWVQAAAPPSERHERIGLNVARILARQIGAELHECE